LGRANNIIIVIVIMILMIDTVVPAGPSRLTLNRVAAAETTCPGGQQPWKIRITDVPASGLRLSHF
jgi:hypothetical protein